MALSVYVHIPYCLQRCRYCDFTTFEWSEILPPERYVDQLRTEIRNRHALWTEREIKTLYFGGGTPSLVDPEHIVNICSDLANFMSLPPDVEKTIEINPATIDEKKLETYMRAGINRFSVGAQTFNDRLLETCGRKHSSRDTRETLKLLRRHNLNYSFDLLFALPGQSMDDLRRDLDEVGEFSPPHLSPYCLTVPEGHSMSAGRPPEGEQVDMFAMIEERLNQFGLLKYEISNFAQPGFESQHNMSYWDNSPYWGIGLSSHSYAPKVGDFGTRFWNTKSLREYAEQVEKRASYWTDVLPGSQMEQLEQHESLTDFCHMHLRMMQGMDFAALRRTFGERVFELVHVRLQELAFSGLIELFDISARLSPSGVLLSNKVFEKLTFSVNELEPGGLTQIQPNSYCSDHERESGKPRNEGRAGGSRHLENSSGSR